MPIDKNKVYKVIDDDLINGYAILTGDQLDKLIDKAYQEVKNSKKQK